MKLICIDLLVIIGLTYGGEYCAYGGFTEDSNGDCKFLCGSEYGDSGSYVDISDLTFDMIKNQCPSVKAAAEINSDCNSLDDLVYVDESISCQCPFCKCSMEDKMGETSELVFYQADETFSAPGKSCYNCTCIDGSAYGYFASGTMVNVCEELQTVNDPNIWNDYNCPPTECEATKEADWNKIKLGGEFWYEDVGDSDKKCETYCYCDGEDGKTCKTGWANIIADEKMVTEFRDNCGYYARACYDLDKESYDASRLFTTDSGPTCDDYDCPRCDCDGKDVGETWYVEYQDEFDYTYGYASCAECTCYSGYSSTGNMDFASCNYLDYYKIGQGSCPQKDEGLSCYDAYYREGDSDNYYSYDYGGVDGTDEPTTTGYSYTGEIVPGEGDIENCTETTTNFGSSMSYCEWTKSKGTDDDEPYYSWGCGVGALCEAYMGTKCFYADFEYTLTDCYGNTEKREVEEYRYCCKTDNCNKVDIEASTSICEASSDFEDLYKGYFDCISDSDSPVYKYGCADIDAITCSALTEMFKYQAGCMCDVYGGLVTKVSSDSIDILQNDADAQMDTFSIWNDALGCNINLECKLTSSGSVLENNSGSSGLVYSVALMWALLSVLYISS